MKKSQTTREIGNIGENAVAEFLRVHHYEILRRNFTVRGGEIDIIARKNNVLVFVEVKTRKENSLVSAERAITLKKRRFIVRTAQNFYNRYRVKHGDMICRFDVACITLHNNEIKQARYYVAAFDAHGV